MRCEAVERHNIGGGRGFRVEELKIRTFVFRFLGLVITMALDILTPFQMSCFH